MNNEIGRKLTSLTLMTIMLASGITAFAPSTMQNAEAANANLFVSAENSQFQNYVAGPMVIEVVVIDSDIKDTDKAKGEPDVTVNGKKLRMVQADDGNWYAYFADRAMAQIADSTVGLRSGGNGLDFGVFCKNTDTLMGITLTDTVGFAVPLTTAGGVNGTTDITGAAACRISDANRTLANVVREPKEPNRNPASGVLVGQIGLNITKGTGVTAHRIFQDVWPFVQLYNFNPTGNIVVQYNKGGGVQSTTLKFDTVDQFAKAALDQTKYTQGAQVHVTLTDLQVNIDPTDEDSWTFQTNSTNSTVSYQVFNENGGATKVDGTGGGNGDRFGVIDIKTALPQLMFEDNGILLFNPDRDSAGVEQIIIQDNDDNAIIYDPRVPNSANTARYAITSNSSQHGFFTRTTYPITVTEIAPNVGVFSTYDESDKSTLKVADNAVRGKSATIDYKETPTTILVGNGFATIDIKPLDSEWNSGEEIGLSVVDSDANKNSRADEDLDLFNADVPLIPAIRIGTPFTLGANGTGVTNSIVVGEFGNVGATRNRVAIADHNSTSEPVSIRSQGFKVLNLTHSSPVKSTSVDGVGYNQTLSRLTANATTTVQKFSDRAIVVENTTAAFAGAVRQSRVDVVVVDMMTTAETAKKTIIDTRGTTNTAAAGTPRLHGFNFFNYDIRGVNSTIGSAEVDTWLLYTNRSATQGVTIPDPVRILYPGVNNAMQISPINAISLGNNTGPTGLINLNGTASLGTAGNGHIMQRLFGTGGALASDLNRIGVMFNFTAKTDAGNDNQKNFGIAADFFSFGYLNDGLVKADRVNNALYRIEAEETGDNTAQFDGTLTFTMLNQLNILNANTYSGLKTVADDVTMIVHQDLDDEEAPRANYNDLGSDGVTTQIGDQEDAPTHSAVVSFDKPTYKQADTVVVTLEDLDINTDSDLIDIYTVVNRTGDVADHLVGVAGLPVLSNGDKLGRLMDITWDDRTWVFNNDGCTTALSNAGITDRALGFTGFTLIETGISSGIFTGDFQVPAKVCRPADTQTGVAKDTSPVNTQGLDMEVNYLDFRDASGQIVEVGDGAGIRANTGSISLDRTVYPIPFGEINDDFTGVTVTDNTSPSGRSIFPLHLTAIKAGGPKGTAVDTANIDFVGAAASFETLPKGILTVHVQVNDPDFDTSAAGEDTINQNITNSTGHFQPRGPVKITVSRGANSVILGYAGSDKVKNGVIDVGADNTGLGVSSVRQLGPITETAPASGIFEFDLEVKYTDGPASTICPTTGAARFDSLTVPGTNGAVTTRFDAAPAAGTGNFCILQGDIITVEYTDPADASGDRNTVTDSATFDLRNGALQSDKSVYIIGSDMIMTLIEPDLDLDNDLAETYDLDLIEWDSDAATVTMGDEGTTGDSFDPEPSDLRETGDSTGIFQTVIEIPKVLRSDSLERGEEIVLEYTDWGPSGADYVGQEDEDINLTIFTSNFGATVELDQKVYTWTDKVYITVVAPDHNFDSNLVDEIGGTSTDPLKVATRGNTINRYKLVETGTDTGIFTGEVILVGFGHDVTGDNVNDAPTVAAALRNTGSGPTDGFLGSDDDDGLTVSYEFSEDETVVGSALIRWNIGEVSWLEASYPASGTGVVRVIDPDMNLRPEAVDNFSVDAWSDSDSGGIDLTVTETNEATGIFEGTVFFTTTDESSGHRLRVAEGDTVTAEYRDETLPDPYTTADELDITGTAFIGTVVPPLERAPASNARVVDAFGNTLDEVSAGDQVQITADLTNGQDREQPFAYLVQVQNEDGVTVALAWISGSLAAGQSFSPALSWTPTESGSYTATVFVWESVDNPAALSEPVSVDIEVS